MEDVFVSRALDLVLGVILLGVIILGIVQEKRIEKILSEIDMLRKKLLCVYCLLGI